MWHITNQTSDGARPSKDRWAVFCGDWAQGELHLLTEARGHIDGDTGGDIVSSGLMRVRAEVPDREGVRIIVRDQRGWILMQHRSLDAPTNPGRWTPIGGAVRADEEPHTAACRVLAEGAGLHPETLIPLGDLYFTAPHDAAWVRHHVYTAATTVPEHDLRPGEGQALRFIDWSELIQLDISPSGRTALAIAWMAPPT